MPLPVDMAEFGTIPEGLYEDLPEPSPEDQYAQTLITTNWPQIWGRRLIKLRRAKQITQVDLARRAKTTQQTLSRIEHGNTEPRMQLQFRICKVLGVKVEDLFGFEVRESDTETFDEDDGGTETTETTP